MPGFQGSEVPGLEVQRFRGSRFRGSEVRRFKVVGVKLNLGEICTQKFKYIMKLRTSAAANRKRPG